MKSLALFFTTKGKSLANWHRLGMLAREIKPYIALAQSFERIYFFSYGTAQDEAPYLAQLPSNIRVVTRPWWIPVVLYSFVAPFMHRRILKDVQFLKTNQMDGAWTAVIAKKLYGSRLIVRCGYEWLLFIERANRSIFKRWFATWVESWAYQNADAIIHTSHEAIAFMQERFPYACSYVIHLPNYIDTAIFSPYQVPQEERSIVFVGRFEPQKNLGTLIDALEGLDITLVMVGKGSQQSELAEHAMRKNVPIIWKDTVPQEKLPELLSHYRVFVLPSLYEGNPKTLLEAMSCGLACVATDVPGSREVIVDGKNGLLCSPTARGLSVAIGKVMNNPALSSALGAAARADIVEHQGLERILQRELSVYTTLL